MTDEMVKSPELGNSPGGLRGAALLYAFAFAGYALVDAGLDAKDPGGKAWARIRLEALVERVLDPRMGAPFSAGQVSLLGHSLSASAALRGHLALMIVGLRALGPLGAERDRFVRALVSGIAADLATARTHLISTYGRRVWPADNEVIAAALELYLFFIEPDPTVARGLAALQGSLASLEDQGRLPPSAVAPDRLAGIDVPRGCALSWTVAMRGLYAPPRAHSLYSRYCAQFFVSMGPIHGFREWPPGVDRPADVDSGPIFAGVGTAASGIGIGASRLAGEVEDSRALVESAQLAGLGAVEASRGERWLERAMAAWARSARSWR